MKLRLTLALVVPVFLFAALWFHPSLNAQHAARTTIPFAFAANDHGLPAGCYKVELQSHSYLQFINCDTGRVVGLLVRSTNPHQEMERSSLVFKLTLRGYRLYQVRFANANLQTDLAVQPKPERELAGNAGRQTLEIALK